MVMDTGIGIEAGRLDAIFDPFHDKNEQNSGAGLGLSLTKKYTEYLGGSVAVESEEGVGSKFIIRVPRISTAKSNEFIEIKNQLADEENFVENELVDDEFTSEISDNLVPPLQNVDESATSVQNSSYTLTSA
jgi:hypothetical protein